MCGGARTRRRSSQGYRTTRAAGGRRHVRAFVCKWQSGYALGPTLYHAMLTFPLRARSLGRAAAGRVLLEHALVPTRLVRTLIPHAALRCALPTAIALMRSTSCPNAPVHSCFSLAHRLRIACASLAPPPLLATHRHTRTQDEPPVREAAPGGARGKHPVPPKHPARPGPRNPRH